MSILLGIESKHRRFERLRAFGGGWLFLGSCVVLVGFVVLAAAAPLVAPYAPDNTDLLNSLGPPSAQHWLGTNQVGQDTLSRIFYGSRTSLIGPLAVVVISTVCGVLLGLWAGWRGGWIDAGLSRIFDMMFAFPGLLVAILAVALFGKGLFAPVVAMAIAYTPFVARLVRSLVLQAKARPYVAAYRVQGFGPVHIAVRRLLPNIAPTVLAQSTLNFGYALLDLAALSFLGLGIQPPTADWGGMINESRGAVLAGEPLSAVAPALAIVIVVVAFNIVGEELADRISGRDG
ncbi:MAG: ABC transporter permease [Nocardioidaceae bacterium]